METKLISKNRKAYHNYKILEVYEAGLVLTGTEVKSIRAGKVNLQDSFARVFKGELYLMNAHISPYSHGNINNHDPVRDRKLLLHKNELNRISGLLSKKGLALVALSLYFKKGRVKAEIGLAQGKKLHDKRESIKKRDIEREEGRHGLRL